MAQDSRLQMARGYVLLAVCYLHVMYALLESAEWSAGLLPALLFIKLLAPHVAVLFAVSGMGAPRIGRRRLGPVVVQSLSLLLVCAVTHVLGFLASHLLRGELRMDRSLAEELVTPLVYGVGYATQVGWFIVVLAVVRVLAVLFHRTKAAFLITCLAVATAIAVASSFSGTDNLWEWRNWPAALLMFLLGQSMAGAGPIRFSVGLISTVVAVSLSAINRPDLLQEGICLSCDLTFVAQPMVGEYGSIPVFAVQEMSALLSLLWLAQFSLPFGIARMVRFVGRHSLSFLLLHGLLIATAFDHLYLLLPDRPGTSFYVVAFVASSSVHVLLLHLLRRPLDRLIYGCSKAARLVVASLSSAWCNLSPGRASWRRKRGA